MNKNSIFGCTYFFPHWKSKHLVSQNIVRICKSVQVIGRCLRCMFSNQIVSFGLCLAVIVFSSSQHYDQSDLPLNVLYRAASLCFTLVILKLSLKHSSVYHVLPDTLKHLALTWKYSFTLALVNVFIGLPRISKINMFNFLTCTNKYTKPYPENINKH